MQATNLHQQEEEDFGRGPVLWDAGEGVCCAYFQLGACAHTEVFDESDLDDEPVVVPAASVLPDDEPF